MKIQYEWEDGKSGEFESNDTFAVTKKLGDVILERRHGTGRLMLVDVWLDGKLVHTYHRVDTSNGCASYSS